MTPNLEGMVDNLTPVDFVSRAIVHLSRQPESAGKAFHLLNPHSTPKNDLFNWLGDLGYSLQQVSFAEWRAALMAEGEVSSDNALYPVLENFAQRKPEQVKEPEFDCQNTLNGLAGTDISFPPVDKKLLELYLSSFISK